ncbi:MAG: hypothetical protein IPJ04_03485 [Candidatus Eisenbacteria bacterium]|nr:hypothetical protein [Candidatus Eisenbacteria bacterium]
MPTSTRGVGEPSGSYAAGAAGVASSGYGVAFSHMKICMESTYAIAGCAPAAFVASTP